MRRLVALSIAAAVVVAACGDDTDSADDVALAQYHVVRATATATHNPDAALRSEMPWMDLDDEAKADFAAWLESDDDAAIYRQVFTYSELGPSGPADRDLLVAAMERVAQRVLWLHAFTTYANPDQRAASITAAVESAAAGGDSAPFVFTDDSGAVVANPDELQRAGFLRWISLLDPDLVATIVPETERPDRSDELATLLDVAWDEAEQRLTSFCDTFGAEPEYTRLCAQT